MKFHINSGTILGKYFYRIYKNKKFSTSDQYWEKRYANGGNSGSGSYSKLAEFKAELTRSLDVIYHLV